MSSSFGTCAFKNLLLNLAIYLPQQEKILRKSLPAMANGNFRCKGNVLVLLALNLYFVVKTTIYKSDDTLYNILKLLSILAE
jgi:hypothetical protein